MMFAAALLPLMAFIGAAIDYSRAVNARSAMQAAIDSTALMISKDAASLSAEQISAKATQYFNALFNRPETTGITLTTTYTANTGSGSTLQIAGSGTIATEFMKMVGYPTLSLNVNSTTTWGSSKLRVNVTRAVVNDEVAPTSAFLRDPDWTLPEPALKRAIVDASADDVVLTERLSGVLGSYLRTPDLERQMRAMPAPVRALLAHPRTKKTARKVMMVIASRRMDAVRRGERALYSAGQSADLVRDVAPVSAIVDRLLDEYARTKQALP